MYLAFTVPHAGGWTINDAETGAPVPSDGIYVSSVTNSLSLLQALCELLGIPTLIIYLTLQNDEPWPDVEKDHASMITTIGDAAIGQILDLLEKTGNAISSIKYTSSTFLYRNKY